MNNLRLRRRFLCSAKPASLEFSKSLNPVLPA
jgi:hypothetical protein